MGRYMEELRDMLCEELDKIASMGELTAGSLDTIDKLSHSIKSLDTIMAMAGYSQESDSYDGGYYYRGRSGAKRGGRYSRTGRYSRDDVADQMIAQLEDMVNSTEDEKVRQAIQKAIRQIKS